MELPTSMYLRIFWGPAGNQPTSKLQRHSSMVRDNRDYLGVTKIADMFLLVP